MSLIAGFDDVMAHIRNQEIRIQKLEYENKELRSKVDEANKINDENMELRKFKEDAEDTCASSVVMEKMLDEIETLKNKNDEYLKMIEVVNKQRLDEKNKHLKEVEQNLQETIKRCKIVDDLDNAIFDLIVGGSEDVDNTDIEDIAKHFDKLYCLVNSDTKQCMVETIDNGGIRIMDTDYFECEFCEWQELSVRNDYVDFMIEQGRMDEDDDDVETLRSDDYYEYDIELFIKWYCEINGIDYCYANNGENVFTRDI
jgi:hypothetical protein